MDSDSQSDDDNQEAISKQILNYYQKYSQTKGLPKYFSGTSVSYMPEIVKPDEIIDKPIIIIDETNSETLVEKPFETGPIDAENVGMKPISPTSSITSNRKLEWDNGADIGYSNCNKSGTLHKSASLPILGSLESKQIEEKSVSPKLTSQIVTVISYSSTSEDNSNQKSAQSSSSSPSFPMEQPQSSSSSSKSRSKPITSSSSSFLNTLAYLKSKIGSPDAESTPNVEKKATADYPETPIIPKKQIRKKVVKLCLTKPIVVECLHGSKRTGLDKEIQTVPLEAFAKSIQTGDSLEITIEPSKVIPVTNQSVIVINCDSDSKRTSSSNTQTSSSGLVGSPCDSFEYYDQHLKNAEPRGEDEAKSDFTPSTNSSKDSPLLGQLITTNQSQNLAEDVDKSIAILQKLLKSKKYDPATKKRYIRKIVQKIVNSKYSGDSTSSSELFVPKKVGEVQQKLQQNVPWYPPQLSKFSVKTFSDEFLPIEPENIAPKKKGIYTITTARDSSSLETATSLEKQKNSSSGSYQSWKAEKTLSEQLLEQRQMGQGDHLVKFAMKERQNQISWINNEISHLTKLKSLLEKKSKMPNIQKTTTVYMLSSRYNKNCSPTSSSKNTMSPPRNYVIQTELGGTSSSGDKIDFNLYDGSIQRNYHVSEVIRSKTGELKEGGKFVGDIEVHSDDKTTNIKVKARKIDGKELKPPSLIGDRKYDTFPKSYQEVKDTCWPCGMARVRPSKASEMICTEKYSFDVPLVGNKNNISNKVGEILNKYVSARPTSSGRRVICNEGVQCGCATKQIAKKAFNEGIQCVLECKSKNGKDLRHEGTFNGNCKSAHIHCPIGDRYKELQAKDMSLGDGRRRSKIKETQLEEQALPEDCNCADGISQTQHSTIAKLSQNKPKKLKSDLFQTAYATRSSKGMQCEANCECCAANIAGDGRRVSKTKETQFKEQELPEDCTCADAISQTQHSTFEKLSQTKPKTLNIDQFQTDYATRSNKGMQCKANCECCAANIASDGRRVSRTKETQFEEQPLPGDCNCADAISQTQHSTSEKLSQTKAKRLKNDQLQTDYATSSSKGMQCEPNCQCCDANLQVQPMSCICSDAKTQAAQTMREERIQTQDREVSDDKLQTDCVCYKDSKVQTECICSNKEAQVSSVEEVAESSTMLSESESDDSSSSSSSTSTETMQSCSCCKRKNVTSRTLYALRRKLSDHARPLCRPCYKQNRMAAYRPEIYNNPTHVCNCYTVVETRTINEIKKTITDLNEMEERFCTCVDVRNREASNYCRYCKCKLRKTTRSKNGIAYMLTFENESPTSEKRRRKKHRKKSRAYLEEIKIKIPAPHKKKLKDKENKRKKERAHYESGSTSAASRNQQQKQIYSLQEYLNKNRPEFVDVAEMRRRLVVDSKTQREGVTDRKKMSFLENHCNEDTCGKNPRRLFTAREMKEITRRNYQKLPEVQQKLIDNREKKLRQADRLIADTFNRKLRENVLKGKRSLSTDVKVVEL